MLNPYHNPIFRRGNGMRVLLVESDSAAAASIELMLKAEGMNVYTTDLGEEGVDLAKMYDYDAIVMELNLPDISGFEMLRRIRAGRVKTPVIICSGTSEVHDKVCGLGMGADDFIAKPFFRDELVARLHAVSRRAQGHSHSVIVTGDMVMNLDARTVAVGGRTVMLTGREYQMLELLTLRKGQTMSKEHFLNHLYGGMDMPEEKIVDVFISKLRKKLNDAATRAGIEGGVPYLETVWGKGYVLKNPEMDEGVPETIVRTGSRGKALPDKGPLDKGPIGPFVPEDRLATSFTVLTHGRTRVSVEAGMMDVNGKQVTLGAAGWFLMERALAVPLARVTYEEHLEAFRKAASTVGGLDRMRRAAGNLSTRLREAQSDILFFAGADDFAVIPADMDMMPSVKAAFSDASAEETGSRRIAMEFNRGGLQITVDADPAQWADVSVNGRALSSLRGQSIAVVAAFVAAHDHSTPLAVADVRTSLADVTGVELADATLKTYIRTAHRVLREAGYKDLPQTLSFS